MLAFLDSLYMHWPAFESGLFVLPKPAGIVAFFVVVRVTYDIDHISVATICFEFDRGAVFCLRSGRWQREHAYLFAHA